MTSGNKTSRPDKFALVTGAHGFVGRNTARYFAKKGWKVIGMGHGIWSREEWNHWGLDDWHSCDITLENLLCYGKEPDVIVHCAGSGSVAFSMSHPDLDYQRTVGTTLAVLEFIRLHTPSTRFIYPSSAAVYGNVSQLPIKEDVPLKPVSMYGVHKKVVEELCTAYGTHFAVSTAVVRFFSVYGVGLRKQLLWDACEKIEKGNFNFFGTGEETRDWLHIEDAASLLFKAGENASIHCPIVNGGSGLEVTVREVLLEVLSCFQISQNPQFSGKSPAGDPTRYLADLTRSREWGWAPLKGWQKGIREYVEWCKKGAL